jgi:hypothetical protein
MQVKIIFDVVDDWHKFATETVWSTALEDGTFQLENVPFFARSVSNKDIVAAKDGASMPEFVDVVRRGGHSTYRMLPSLENLPNFPGQQFHEIVDELRELGCLIELGEIEYVPLAAIDLAPEIDADKIFSLLKEYEKSGAIIFQVRHDGHPKS